MRSVEAFQGSFRYQREVYDLPDLLEPGSLVYEVKARGIRLVEQQGRFGLVKEGQRQAVEVPKEVSEMVRWVIGRPQFRRSELEETFADAEPARLERFLSDMERMGLIQIGS